MCSMNDINNLFINESIVNGEGIISHGLWLMAHGSGLKAHGSRLMVHGQESGGPQGQMLGPGPGICSPFSDQRWEAGVWTDGEF